METQCYKIKFNNYDSFKQNYINEMLRYEILAIEIH